MSNLAGDQLRVDLRDNDSCPPFFLVSRRDEMKYNDLDALIEDMVERYPVPAEACVRALRYLNRHPDFRDFVLGELIDQ